MYKELWRQRPLLTLPQIIILLLVGAAVFVAVDLNRRAQAGQLVGVGETDLQAQVDAESTRQVSLQVTLEYVQSDDYIAAYARDEAGYVLPGEKRVVPLVIEATPLPTAVPTATPDPIQNARPWQAWWHLLVNAPQPSQ
ncbi:septum formation initiator family protein [Candidatus Leptofilum sp.]|uniref:septum formation initiator family protein n=1 Tax=Candidatus Leptofilum sp. TaxID=3241576 RepID=UPI003B5A59DA